MKYTPGFKSPSVIWLWSVPCSVTGLWLKLASRASTALYRVAAIGRSDDLKRIARVSYEAGERGILELLDAYRSASTARARLADLDALVAEAEIELEYISGWENLR